jgi:hypothetical protein
MTRAQPSPVTRDRRGRVVLEIHHVAIIGCGKSKLDHAAPARDLYTGSLFRAALAHAEATADLVLIASAKHGLLRTSEPIEPYEQKLRRGGAGAFVRDRSIDDWRDRVAAQTGTLCADLLGHGILFSVFAGADYASPIKEAIRLARIEVATHVRDPLAGMTVGRRLHWFREQRELRGTGEPPLEIEDEFLARVQRELDTPEPDAFTEDETEDFFARHHARIARHTGQGGAHAALEAHGQRRLFREQRPNDEKRKEAIAS